MWAITNRDLHGGQTPVLSSVVITSELYSFPVPAVQKGSTSPITQNDDRMQQAEWINGSVSAELETGITIGSDPTVRDGAAWFKIAPTLNGPGPRSAAPPSRGRGTLPARATTCSTRRWPSTPADAPRWCSP